MMTHKMYDLVVKNFYTSSYNVRCKCSCEKLRSVLYLATHD